MSRARRRMACAWIAALLVVLGSTPSTAVGATTIDTTLCPAPNLSFGMLTSDATAVTGSCRIGFGNDTGTSMLRMYQSDQGGIAMPGQPSGAVTGSWSLNDVVTDLGSLPVELATPGGANEPTFIAGAADYGRAFNLDGNDYATAIHAAGRQTTAYTADLWVRLDVGAGATPAIILDSSAGGQSWLRLRTESSCCLVATVTHSGGTPVTASASAASLVGATWRHVAVTAASGGSLRLYIDGVQVATTAIPGTIDTPASPLYIGGGPSQLGIDGAIDEVRLANAETPSATIGALRSSFDDYGVAGRTWAVNARGAFGFCVDAVGGAGVTSAVVADTGGSCAPGDAPYWHELSNIRTSSDVAGTTTPAVTDATLDLVFGARVGTTTPPGNYRAGVTIEVYDPNVNAPQSLTAPTVTGTLLEGESASSTDGTWSGSPVPTITRQWRQCDVSGANCTDIPGATGTTLLLDSTLVGAKLRLRVTATNIDGSAVATSAASAIVAPRVPVGTMVPLATATIPAGYLAANGQSVTTAAYPDLFALVGYTYGGSGGNFNVPDMRGRAGRGVGSLALGQANGSASWAHGHAMGLAGHAHTVYIGSHAHSATYPSHQHNFAWAGSVMARLATSTGCGVAGCTSVGQAFAPSQNTNTGFYSGGFGSSAVDPGGAWSGTDAQGATVSTNDAPWHGTTWAIRASTAATSSAPCAALWYTGRTTAPAGATLVNGTGTTTCNGQAIPDSRNRFDAMAGANGITHNGANGQETHSVTPAQHQHWVTNAVPAHSHTFSPPSHDHSFAAASTTGRAYTGGTVPTQAGVRTSAGGVTGANGGGTVGTSSNGTGGSSLMDWSGVQGAVGSSASTPPYLAINRMAFTGASYTVPAGTVSAYAGAAPPLGWVWADGQTLDRTIYATLFAAIGTTFGAPSGTTFQVPNLTNRMPIHAGTNHAHGAAGGVDGHSHTAAIPDHQHGFSFPDHTHSVTFNDHTHTIGFSGSVNVITQCPTCNAAVSNAVNAYSSGWSMNSLSTGTSGYAPWVASSWGGAQTGTSGAANNEPPQRGVRYMIKT